MIQINSKQNIIEAIFICQLHDHKGKQIVECQPKIDEKSIITYESFNLIVQFILPIDELCNRFICLEFKQNYFIIGIPTLVRNKQLNVYFRAIFKYGVMVVVKKDKFLKQKQMYIEIVKKVSYFFACLEEEKHVIYKSHRPTLKQLLKNVFVDFNYKKEAYLQYQCERYTFISAKISKLKKDLPEPKPYHVPITNLNTSQINQIQIEQIKNLLLNIEKGEDCIQKLAIEMNQQVKKIIEQIKIMIQYGIVTLVDIFNTQNVYVLTNEIHEFANDQVKLAKMKQVLVKKDQKNLNLNAQDLLHIYLKFNRGFTVEKIGNKYQHIFCQISIMKFIRYGMIKGILKRCYQIIVPPPNYLKNCNDKNILQKYIRNNKITHGEELQKINLQKMGEEFLLAVKLNSTLDQLCINLSLDRETLLQILKQEGIVTILS